MIAIVGGLGAALAFAAGAMCSSRSSKAIGSISVVAWVMVVGLVVSAPLALAGGIPHRLGGTPAAYLAVSAGGNVAGLLSFYAALRVGKVALVAPLISTEGAIAAVVAVAAGESLAPAAAGAITMVALGVGLSSMPSDGAPVIGQPHPLRAPILAMTAAICFGISLYATAKAGDALPWPWVVLSARVVGVLAVMLPLATQGRLRLTRRAAPLVAMAGVLEVLGFFCFIVGSKHGIAITAVTQSQFATFAVIGGYVVFGERISRTQATGIVVLVIGVTMLSAVQA